MQTDVLVIDMKQMPYQITEEDIANVIRSVPSYGVDRDRYFIINNNLTLNNSNNLVVTQILNTFAMLAINKAPMTQIIKNNAKEHTQQNS